MASWPVYRATFLREGRCVDCKQARPDVRGFVPRCQPCRCRFNAYRRARYYARKRLGLCPNCGNRPPWWDDEDGRQYLLCEQCITISRRYAERQKLAQESADLLSRSGSA